VAASFAGRLKLFVPWLLFVVLLLLPTAHLGSNSMRLLFGTAVWITCSVAWNLLGGFAGQVSFGFAVFYGLGAYTAALLINAGVSPYLAFPAAAVVAVLASFVVGLPTFRLRGPYFVIATIGVGEATRVVMNNLAITGGASGLRVVEPGPFRQLNHYYTAMVLMALAVALSAWIAHSKFGLALRAVKQDQDAAADVGVNPYTSKLWVHAIAAALTGMAGGVYARYHAFIYPGDVFAFQTSISILLMPVIGGIGTVWGAVLGGVIFGIVEEELVVNFPNIHLLLYGSLLILIILFEPGGLMGLLRRLSRLLRSNRRREDPGSPDAEQVLWGSGGAQGR
jgi:branched-chain amino acid transport system permease protein